MTDSPTLRVQRCLDRLRGGEAAARDELIRSAGERLRQLTRKMLRGFADVRRWEETGDVFQNAMLRLCRALDAAVPPTPLHFFRLAAMQVRRELIDLARHYRGPEGQGANHATQRPTDSGPGLPEPAAQPADPADLAAWTEFHEQVEKLPEEEREVFDLLWYQGLKQAEAAELLGVNERTIKRRWQSARLALHDALGGRVPEM